LFVYYFFLIILAKIIEWFLISKRINLENFQLIKKNFQRKIAVNRKYVHLNFNSLFNGFAFCIFSSKKIILF